MWKHSHRGWLLTDPIMKATNDLFSSSFFIFIPLFIYLFIYFMA